VGIQDTKKKGFSIRILHALSTSINTRFQLKARGASGGILVSIKDSKFEVLYHWMVRN
jgi:hypothetical protein